MNYATVHPTKRLLVNVAPGNDRAARDVTAAQRFRQRDDIRFKVPMLEPKHLAGPPQTTLHFVANEKCAIFPAQGLRALEEICSGGLTTLALHRFDHECGDIALRQLALERCDVIERNTRIPFVHERAETFGKAFATHQRQRSDAESVERAFERNDAFLAGSSAREFECAFCRFGPGVTKENGIEMRRCAFHDGFG